MPRNLSHDSAGSSSGLTARVLKSCDLVVGIPPTSVSAGHDVDIPATYWILERSDKGSVPRTRP